MRVVRALLLILLLASIAWAIVEAGWLLRLLLTGALVAALAITAFKHFRQTAALPSRGIPRAKTPLPTASHNGRLPITVHQSHPPMPAIAPASIFDVEIPEARLRRHGVYEIAHATPYTIVLGNQHPELRCDARVWIDGTPVGTWRVEPASRIRLERPLNDSGRFTFFQLGSAEAARAGLDAGNAFLGLIRVKFMPEVTPEKSVAHSSDMDSQPINSGSPKIHPSENRYLASSPGSLDQEDGGTGLSGHSDQSFHTASPIRHDEFAEIIRQVRLVALPAIRPIRSVV